MVVIDIINDPNTETKEKEKEEQHLDDEKEVLYRQYQVELQIITIDGKIESYVQ